MITTQPKTALTDALQKVHAAIPPLWPLKDYVAVNPFLGFMSDTFLDAKQKLDRVRDAEMLMPMSYFHTRFNDGELTQAHIQAAVSQCQAEYPSYFGETSTAIILQALKNSDISPASSQRLFHTVAETIDAQVGTSLASAVTDEISRHLAAHYDEGQAYWPSPWNDLPLYQAWRETALIDRRAEKLGINNFRELVASLPESPQLAIAELVEQLRVDGEDTNAFLQCQLFSIAGWASYVRYRVRQAEMIGSFDDDLIGLLAIRLAYDVAILETYPSMKWSARSTHNKELNAPDDVTLIRYVLQVAAELAYREPLVQQLVKSNEPASSSVRSAVQMVFCIDVRSELIRRHLEAASERIETFGFAGFFALAMEYVPLGDQRGTAQCPVLLWPGFKVREGLRGVDEAAQFDAIHRRSITRFGRSVWKAFASSATSTFSFVEALGSFYLFKLIGDGFGFSRPVPTSNHDGVARSQRHQLGPILMKDGEFGVTLDKQTDLAEGILKNLGLTQNIGRLVVICGHGAETANNPYKAGLDCGACGGHTGESNARVAATILNHESVRAELVKRGIIIPGDAWFLAALHNTTTDEISFYDTDLLPDLHQKELADLKSSASRAAAQTRAERAARMSNEQGVIVSADDLLTRSHDWSEVRPEWGLAGNAAFIVAPRSRTRNLKLDGRTFMHSYVFASDPDLKVLELIMTAPMIVTNWINMQYYASAVDNKHYGSGNKAIHNVVGNLGVFLGTIGDLQTGLPWQSVHDGTKLQHEPLRLFVAIEAPREAISQIVDKHAMVRDLATNGWLTLAAIEGDCVFQYHGQDGWQQFEVSNGSRCKPFD